MNLKMGRKIASVFVVITMLPSTIFATNNATRTLEMQVENQIGPNYVAYTNHSFSCIFSYEKESDADNLVVSVDGGDYSHYIGLQTDTYAQMIIPEDVIQLAMKREGMRQ